MKNAFLPDAKRYQRAHRRRRLWHRIVTALAAVVVFCTTYALILPAITLENNYICGQDEHQHGSDCFQTVQTEQFSTVLVCVPEGHSHTADCFDAEGHLVCGLADVVLHRHDEYCFDEAGQLICALPAVVEHIHGEDCWQETQELICGQEEAWHEHGAGCTAVTQGACICGQEEGEAHQHTTECYEQLEELICQRPEDPAGHRHTDTCWQAAWTLTCTQEQIAEHEHTPDCSDESGALVCGILSAQTHQHTDACRQQVSGGFAEEAALACGLPEHTHTEECLPAGDEAEPPEDTPEQADEAEPVSGAVQYVIDRIAALPTAEEVAAILTAYEESGYQEGYEAYYSAMTQEAKTTYGYYEELMPEEQELVANREKLLELEWLWGAETLTENFEFDTPTVVPYASTRDFIDLNLYDYNKSINNYYNSNKKYPGFQWNGGAYMESNTFNRHVVDYIDFGNSNITDIGYGGSNVRTNGLSKNAVIAANKGGDINKLDISSYGVTNRPIGMSVGIEALSRTLKDGYPALTDGTSLSYLFTNGEAVTKQNTESIDGLFQKDEKTGAYYYNSRWNHAQYSNDKFTLYDQIITPNFIVYPFGNFLPFNTITDSTKATQVGKITAIGGYGQKIINDLVNSSNYKDSATKQQLVDMLAKYRTDLSSVSASGGNAWDKWSAKNAIEDYFTAGGGSGDKPSGDTSPITDALLNKMYNIDWDEETNFFFGMDMSMNFLQPKGGLTGNDGQQPMVFYFTGDDDVWVYVDGVLFLDLTGIHRHVGGEIDFVNGLVHYYALDTEHGGDVSSTPYKTYTFAELLTAAGKSTDGLNDKGTFKDYTTHSFKFFYMERGSGSSVCRLNFNFPLLRKNSISVTKELSVDDESKLPLLGDPDFRFQVLKEDGGTPFIGAGTSYDILDTKGSRIGTGTTGENGVFTLKAGQMAVFSGIQENAGRYFVRELLDADVFGQYGSVSVNGSSTTQDSYTHVTVGSDTFRGVDSPVKDVSEGSTVFRFDNNVTTSKLGGLTITKTVTDYEKARITGQFQFRVTLDGAPLPAGTAYQVGSETRYAAEGGLITLAPGETAVIANILAGTRFTVTETEASSAGYVVSYIVGDVTTSDQASGVIGVESTVAVTVNNAETGASVEIPVQKTLLTPDGWEHIYTFTLTQVKGKNDLTPVDGFEPQTLEITVALDTGEGSFQLDYPLVDLGSLPKTFCYRIAEVIPEESTGTIYDQSVYVAEVTVSEASGELQAAVTGIWKAGSEDAVTAVTFTNQIQRYELPQTGGSGVQFCYIAGAALLAAAYLLYRSNKRGKGACSNH